MIIVVDIVGVVGSILLDLEEQNNVLTVAFYILPNLLIGMVMRIKLERLFLAGSCRSVLVHNVRATRPIITDRQSGLVEQAARDSTLAGTGLADQCNWPSRVG